MALGVQVALTSEKSPAPPSQRSKESAMSDIRVLKGDGKRAEDVTGELGDRIKALIYEYEGRMPLAAAVGVLHLVAYEITRDSD